MKNPSVVEIESLKRDAERDSGYSEIAYESDEPDDANVNFNKPVDTEETPRVGKGTICSFGL